MMKNFIFILFSVVFLSCEIYEQPSNPQFNLNGRWDVVDINVVIDKVNYGSNVLVTNEERASVSPFLVTGITDKNELVLSQDFNSTSLQRRFDKKSTSWEFDYNTLIISDQYQSKSYYINFPCFYCTKLTKIDIVDSDEKTMYTFSVDTYGAMPSNELILTSQNFYTNILVGGNQYDKAIISHLEITLHNK